MSQIVINIPKPHSGQQPVLSHPARFKVLRCGRRFGKTETGIIEAATTAIDGKLVGWFAPTYKILDEARRKLVRILQPVTKSYSKQDGRLELITGGVIDFWSMDNADPGRGRKYHLAIIDEAGIVRNLRDCWLAAIRPTLSDYRGKALFLGTPKGVGFFGQLFNKSELDEGWQSWQRGTVHNPYIDPDEIEAARRELPENIFNQEYMGIPDDDGGNPFGLTAIQACHRKLVTPGEVVCYGVDLAKSFDWTWITGVDAQGQIVYSQRWQSAWSETRRRLIEIIGDKPALVDSTGVGDPILEDIAAECDHAEGFKFTRTSKQQIMEGLRTAIQTKAIAFDDAALLAELEAFTYEYRPGGGVVWSAPDGMHDDGVCSLALCVELQRRLGNNNAGHVEVGSVVVGSAFDDFEDDDFWD